jgi:hypothetical protein
LQTLLHKEREREDEGGRGEGKKNGKKGVPKSTRFDNAERKEKYVVVERQKEQVVSPW